jgi:hypothetical protein
MSDFIMQKKRVQASVMSSTNEKSVFECKDGAHFDKERKSKATMIQDVLLT